MAACTNGTLQLMVSNRSNGNLLKRTSKVWESTWGAKLEAARSRWKSCEEEILVEIRIVADAGKNLYAQSAWPEPAQLSTGFNGPCSSNQY